MARASSIYQDKSPSLATKLALASTHFVFCLISVSFLLNSKLVQAVFGSDLQSWNASPLRRSVLASLSLLYFLRTLLTVFIFVRRRMQWGEVAVIGMWVAVFNRAFVWSGYHAQAAFALWGVVGLFFALAGSLTNTGSEYQRHRWKQRPENFGHFLTTGFFRCARHINYFGDLVLFLGWSLVSGEPILLAIPVIMFVGFAFVNVPAQDRYLETRYGAAYRDYMKRTASLIPFIY